MPQENQPLTIYRLRVCLLRTSPHVWRRILVRPSSTLAEFHQTILCAFGWADIHRHRFLIRGCSFAGSNGSEAGPRLSEFQFRLGERFFYDLRFQDGQDPVWRQQIRLEKIVEAEREDSFPRCTEGRGSPPLDQVSNPAELADLSELFTPRYIVHRLAELVDQDSDDRRIAQELRHLRPWLDLKTFRLREANQRLGRQIGARP
jgi:hypothetical protein